MLKDYIRALQTSFTTVTGLRDVLVKIFKGLDKDLEDNYQTKFKSIDFSGTTSAGGNLLISDQKLNILYVSGIEGSCVQWVVGSGGTTLHITDYGTSYSVRANASISGTAYYVE